jgi:hypothetical protein
MYPRYAAIAFLRFVTGTVAVRVFLFGWLSTLGTTKKRKNIKIEANAQTVSIAVIFCSK